MGKQGERTMRDGNGRVARLARWLQQQPAEHIDMLALETKEDGDWKRLQVWPRANVSQQLAQTIDTVITDLANELGTYLTARVVWMVAETGAYWTEHSLRVQPEDLDLAQAFSGDAQSIAIQNQRHQERIVGVHIGGFHSAIQALRETNADMREVARITTAENARLRDELAELRAQLAELESENARLQQMADDALTAAERSEEAREANESDSNVIKMIGTAIGLPTGT